VTEVYAARKLPQWPPSIDLSQLNANGVQNPIASARAAIIQQVLYIKTHHAKTR